MNLQLHYATHREGTPYLIDMMDLFFTQGEKVSDGSTTLLTTELITCP